MKNLDVFIVRYLPIFLFIYSAHIINDCANGISQYPMNLLHSNSAIYALALLLISLANDKYHCVWNRAMYFQLFLTPVINYLDGKYSLFTIEMWLNVAHSIWRISAIITVMLAVFHYIKVRRLKHKTTIYEEYKIRNNEAK